MKYIKTFLWIFFLSVIYASGILRFGGISAELLFIFSGAFAFNFKNVKSAVPVSVVSAAIMSALGGRSFAFCMIFVVCFSLFCIYIKSGRKPILKFGAFSVLCSCIFEGAFYTLFCMADMSVKDAFLRVIIPCGIYTAIASPVILALIKKSFAAKERFIFWQRR